MKRYFRIALAFVILIALSGLLISTKSIFGGVGGTIILFFAVVTGSVYMTMRQRERRDTTEGMQKYKHYGEGLLLHAVALLIMGVLLTRASWWLGGLVCVAAVFFGYEGWRAKNGYKWFIRTK